MPQQALAHLASVAAIKAIGVGVLATARVRGRPGRVYWAEDALDDQYLIRQTLPTGNAAAKVEFFPDGKALLEAVKKRKPDLVVLDLNMPVMDGITALRTLRATHAADVLPVVIFSTARNEAEERTCRGLGIADYVQKPVQFSQLNAVVQQVLAFAQA